MKTMIAKLTDNEILMCERWQNVKKYNIRTDDLEYCYRLLYGKGLDNTCPDCLRNYASQVNNYFNTIREKFNSYKEKQKLAEKPVETPVVNKTSTKAPSKETSKKAPKRTSKKTTPKTKKKVVKKDDNINLI